MSGMKLRSRAGVLLGRAAVHGLALTGRPGTTLPGYLAERLSSTVLTDIMKGRTYTDRIVVTGTNGKTTATRLIGKVLEADGREVVSNVSGSNLYRGVLTTILRQGSRKQTKQTLVLEVDEASLPRVCAAVQPTHLVVLNLFRDQLDRYGEVSTTQTFIQQAIADNPKMQLVLCADDPWVAMLGQGHKAHVEYFGLDLPGLVALPHDDAGDYPLSPQTKVPLVYSQRYFSHIGKYAARDKTWKRPAPTILVDGYSEEDDSSKTRVLMQKKHHIVTSTLTGIYNSYNIVATIGLAHQLGIPMDCIKRGVEQATAAFGRQEKITRAGVDYQLFLIKNPTGFNQVISTSLQGEVSSTESTLIIINDNFADGRDISWLWDVAIEDMKQGGRIIVSGIRAYDMGLRLRYAGIKCQVVTSIPHALHQASRSARSVKILPTYTALLEVRQLLGLSLGDIG